MDPENKLPAGLHIVAKARAGKPPMWYVYAWRGGPCIHKQEATRPTLTAELVTAAAEAFRKRRRAPKDIIAGLIEGYRASPEYRNLAATTRATWTIWLDRIHAEFGDAPIEAFDDRRMRGDVLAWRDRWAHQPASADLAVDVIRRLLSFGVDRGRLTINIAAGIARLYDADRSDIIWLDADFDAFNAEASKPLQFAVRLAAATGLRRSDLVRLPWSAIGPNAIFWRTGKSRGRTRITIPLLPETRVILEEIKAHHAAVQARRQASRRKALPETVLGNSYDRSWTPSGFEASFKKAKKEAGIAVRLHDLRGTFATRCMIAGLTDQEIAGILGWSLKSVAEIRAKYVDQARVVVAIGERIAATQAAGV